tara:strand:- start:4279 stop:5184 length:906 start_codon:yes stop_codon:yes gene_type:complete
MIKRILLIGFGFIGSSLYSVLRQNDKNLEIVVIDRNKPPSYFNSMRHKWIISDYRACKTLKNLLVSSDYIFYFVSTTVPCTSVVQPSKEVSDNIIPFLRILEEVRKSTRAPLIVFPSSASVYGHQKKIPIKENALISPISFHGLFKSTIEQYLLLYSKKFNLRSVILRISNPYGIMQNTSKGQGIIPLIIKSIKNNQSLTLYGASICTRDFIHVNDLARALEALILKKPEKSIYNISSASETKLSDLIEIIQKLYKCKLDFESFALRSTDIKRSCLDSSLFSREFNWSNRIDIKEGLAEFF